MLFFVIGVLWTLTRGYRRNLDFPLVSIPSKTSTSTSPDKNGYIHLITLPFKLHQPPPPVHRKPKRHGSPRLILVGDVHGALDELKALLQKVDFDPNSGTDHLVLTGDMIAKGPKSGGVLDLMGKLSEGGVASCVRGNHDDRVVRADDELVDIEKKKGSKRKQRKRASDEAVAKILTPVQAKYLASCPLILRVHGAGHRGGELLVVHAGIVPGVSLLKQNPKLLMNMRTILPPKGAQGKGKTEYEVGRGSSTTKGRHWAEVWNEWEEKRLNGDLGEQELKTPEGITVVYGHYAAKGLDVRRWTKGMDSNCVRGGRLSALVVKKEKGEVVMEVVSVKCKKYVS
ncbi:Ser/Thr protein phosphatase family protein-like protein [Tirmania nivea]|nr:Ser/Thr protein phosphatase family protein-like protein [Tirmania nivea]